MENSTITYHGSQEGFDLQSGSTYTATDLFDAFKGIMPGDKLTEELVFRNADKESDYVKLYFRTEFHGEEKWGETAESMQDFLSRLTMRIYHGETLLYEGAADENGAVAENVPLGSLKYNEEIALRVELEVPADLENEYAERAGEVDWIFLAEEISLERLTIHKVWEDNGNPQRPQSVVVRLKRDGEIQTEAVLSGENQWTYTWEELDDRYAWSVEEVTPAGYEVSYKMEDNIVFIKNHNGYQPPKAAEPEDITVKKVWSEIKGALPDSVSVTLYNGNQAVDKAVLSARNDWTHTWKNLDGNGNWSVLETGIPQGYTPTYHAKAGVVTITNTGRLIQTGQTTWPIAAFCLIGVCLCAVGIRILCGRKRKKHA